MGLGGSFLAAATVLASVSASSLPGARSFVALHPHEDCRVRIVEETSAVGRDKVRWIRCWVVAGAAVASR